MRLAKTAATLVLTGILLLMASACDILIREPATTSVAVSVEIPSAKVALGTTSDIAGVSMDVKQGSTVLVSGQSLSGSGASWSGSLSGLPVGVSLEFIGHAHNSSTTEIFAGTTTKTLSASGNSVALQMAPLDDGAAVSLPRIVNISLPSSVEPSDDASVNASVTGPAGSTLSYAFSAAASGGSFTPGSGSVTLDGSGNGTFTVTYNAPSTTGTYTHSLSVNSASAYSVEQEFDTVVSESTGTGRVALFVNGSYVDYGTGTGNEAGNLEETLTSLGHDVTTFTGTTASDIEAALAGADVLAIPEQELSPMDYALDTAGRAAIADFVSGGGTLVLFWASYGVSDLLSSVFGYSISTDDGTYSAGPYALNAPAASGTPFASAPSSLPKNNATDVVLASSLPAGAKAIYTNTYGNAAVTLIPRGTQDNGWLQVLDLAVRGTG